MLVACHTVPAAQPAVKQLSSDGVPSPHVPSLKTPAVSSVDLSDIPVGILGEWLCKAPFTLDTRTEFNVHWLRSHQLNSVWGDANLMCIEPIHLWRWIGTESELNSMFIHRITIKSRTATPPQTAASSSKLSLLGHHTRSIRRLRYEL